MKKLLLLFAVCFASLAQAQYTTIPDVNFEKKLIALKLDDMQDGKVLTANINTVTELDVWGSQISDLTGIQGFVALETLKCSSNGLTSLDVTQNTLLKYLDCIRNNLTTLDVSKNKDLINLFCGEIQKVSGQPENSITSLDLSQNLVLEKLQCPYNKLTTLDVSKNKKLNELYCNSNLLTNLDVNNNTALTYLNCGYNKLTALDISHNESLTYFSCFSNQLTTLDVSHNTAITEMWCGYNKLTTIDLSHNTALTFFNCFNNYLTDLDVSHNIALTTLACLSNKLAYLDVSRNIALTFLSCSENKLTSLYVYRNTALEYLDCSLNQLTDLYLNYNTALTRLKCNRNQLYGLDLRNNKLLYNLSCGENQLTSLDVSNNKELKYLECGSSPTLTSLFVKNGFHDLKISHFAGNKLEKSDLPALKYACLDDFNFNQLSDFVGQAEINSYCSFTPGGTYYTLQGTSKLDVGDNGCDAQDANYPNLKLNITNGTTSGSFVANSSGNYNIPLQAGNYTLTPVIENPSYFTVSPASFTVNFPTQTSPFVQDICVTPNGVHHDLETILIPQGNAVPGFEAKYTLTYKNKGNQTETGQITFSYDDNVMDFVSASTTPLKVESGLLTFEYSALQPFASNNITLVFRMNKPTDTPALNGGNVLTFTATISAATTDETQLDNVATLNQTVRNSYDPNDKTCLEGNIVTPDLIGQYVHYLIRFENTGSLEARNIVVKDMIDTAKFDVNSLIVTNTSHPCVTRISDTNKVEFILENINLPFDNATNDGYITFKIKTLPSLVVGDTFSNTADIFFDYNFPIITNEAKTTVQTLGISDFAFEQYFSLYPNPTKDQLSLNAKSSIEVNNIGIYNTLGQLVLAIPNAQTVTNFDVSRLTIGTYFVKIATNKGMSTAKFIKE